MHKSLKKAGNPCLSPTSFDPLKMRCGRVIHLFLGRVTCLWAMAPLSRAKSNRLQKATGTTPPSSSCLRGLNKNWGSKRYPILASPPPPAYYAARSDLLMPRHGKSQRIGIQWLWQTCKRSRSFPAISANCASLNSSRRNIQTINGIKCISFEADSHNRSDSNEPSSSYFRLI